MTIKIFHVKEFLYILKSFIGDKKKGFEKNFKRNYEINVNPNGTDYANYDYVKQFCLNAEFIVEKENIEKENIIAFTELGQNIFKKINLNNEFNQIIIEKCLTNNYFSNILIPILQKFQNNKNKLWEEPVKVFDIFKNSNNIDILQILYDIEFLLNDSVITVNPIHVENFIIVESIKNKRPQSQSEIDTALAKQKMIGEFAEKIVLKYEMERLEKIDCSEKANHVEQISGDWANKGYDIESFNGKSSDDILHDRFIEVKGTTGEKFSIFWSENEINTAKDLQDQYWIYLVTEIDVKTGLSPNMPEMISNPYKKIKPYDENSVNNKFMKRTKTIHVTKND